MNIITITRNARQLCTAARSANELGWGFPSKVEIFRVSYVAMFVLLSSRMDLILFNWSGDCTKNSNIICCLLP